MVKITCLDDAFLGSFLTASKPSRRSITAAKRNEKKKKERQKKKNRKASRHMSLSGQNFNFCTCLSHNVIKRNVSERKASCHVANAFWTRLKLIWPIFSLKISKMSRSFWATNPGGRGLNYCFAANFAMP